MTVANKITIFRIILIPFFIFFLLYGYKLISFLVFCLAGISDAVDGFIARTQNQKSEIGTILDPLADKLLLVTSLVTLSILGKIPTWLVIIVVSREIILIAGSLLIHMTTGSLKVQPHVTGKIATFFQLATVALALLYYYLMEISELILISSWCAAVFTTISGLYYIYLGTKLLNSDSGMAYK